MRILTKSILFAIIVIACGCTSKVAKQTLEEYNNTFAQVQELELLLAVSDLSTFSGDEIRQLYELGKDLYYSYNPMDLKPEQVVACKDLQERVKTLKEEIISKTNEQIGEMAIYPYKVSDRLFETSEVFPVYLLKGETLKVNVSSSKSLTVKISNASSRTVLKTLANKTLVQEVMPIQNSAIYLVEIIPNGNQYVDYEIYYKPTTMERLCNATQIDTEQVECQKGEFGAKGIPGIEMRKCFEEPRKFTLRGQLKAAFSGSSKALVAVQVPAGATDILYSMRIATSERDRSDDGEFHDNLTRSYKRVKFLGLPLYEKTSSNGLLNTILDDNRPIREEDAYCNMYVFRNKTQAKHFQDGTKAVSLLNYDVDYSTVGTQSCNGRIPVKGLKTIYLGFENERMRYTNYLWVEVEAVVPNTVYYRTKYSID
ncbi:MAG: hypothetical protein IKY54_02890 [Muribaculaceae bacterium]|nr:hypothetical protein [Muribaculaceae bacterium]